MVQTPNSDYVITKLRKLNIFHNYFVYIVENMKIYTKLYLATIWNFLSEN